MASKLCYKYIWKHFHLVCTSLPNQRHVGKSTATFKGYWEHRCFFLLDGRVSMTFLSKSFSLFGHVCGPAHTRNPIKWRVMVVNEQLIVAINKQKNIVCVHICKFYFAIFQMVTGQQRSSWLRADAFCAHMREKRLAALADLKRVCISRQ